MPIGAVKKMPKHTDFHRETQDWTIDTYPRRLNLQCFQHGVILECAGLCGLPGLWSVLHACVCATAECESVSEEYSVTQESNVAACGFLTGSIVVEGDMFS